jgi:hypothetical protein
MERALRALYFIRLQLNRGVGPAEKWRSLAGASDDSME